MDFTIEMALVDYIPVAFFCNSILYSVARPLWKNEQA